MERITIGKITAPVGLKGEIRINNYSDREDRYETLDRIFVGEKEYAVASVRYAKGMPVLKLKGVDDIDAAAMLRGKEVAMSEDDLDELEEGTFYIRDLIGIDACDAATGEKLGTVEDVLTDRPQDLYVIKLAKAVREAAPEGSDAARTGRIYIPAVEAFVKTIDIENRRIEIAMIEGIL